MRAWSVEGTSTIAMTISMTTTPARMTARFMTADGTTRIGDFARADDSLTLLNSTINLPKQKTQGLWKAFRPLALVVSCALVDLHQQTAIIQACAA